MRSDELQQQAPGRVPRDCTRSRAKPRRSACSPSCSASHAVEELLTALRDAHELSGDDFVPVVVKLDELLDHMQLRSAACRSTWRRRARRGGARRRCRPNGTATTARHRAAAGRPTARPAALEQPLQRLAARGQPDRRAQVRLRLRRPGARAAGIPGAGQATSASRWCAMPSCTASSQPSDARRQPASRPRGTVRVSFNDAGHATNTRCWSRTTASGLDYEQILRRARCDADLLEAGSRRAARPRVASSA